MSKIVMHIFPQSVPIEMSGLGRGRKMWACLAAYSRFLCGRGVIWVEDKVSPLCKVMGMGWFEIVLLTHRVSEVI